MWNIYPLTPEDQGGPTILVTDDQGYPVALARPSFDLVSWLYEQAQDQIVVQIAGEPVTFSIQYSSRAERIAALSELEAWLAAADPHPKWPHCRAMLAPDPKRAH